MLQLRCYSTNLSCDQCSHINEGQVGMVAPGRLLGFEGWIVDQTLQQQMQPGSQTMSYEACLILPAVPKEKKIKYLHEIIIITV